jgi:hypothetical protein
MTLELPPHFAERKVNPDEVKKTHHNPPHGSIEWGPAAGEEDLWKPLDRLPCLILTASCCSRNGG